MSYPANKVITKIIPTNIITGFLGVGKTTAILQLLQQKPSNERWAVLVNEFGEVGIDGQFYANDQQAKTGIFIREIAGGCMCCVNGISMQISLNMLLAKAKPDRLLIEPTGLGHPKEVLSMLSGEHYKSVLDLRATITLVDARKIKDTRYTSHQIFNQQLEVADVILANKSDQYQGEDLSQLTQYLANNRLLKDKKMYVTSYGKIDFDWLNCPSSANLADHLQTEHTHNNSTNSDTANSNKALEIPECGYLTIENQGEGFYSLGIIFKNEYQFDESKLFALLQGLEAERIKASFCTAKTGHGYNKADGILTQFPLNEDTDNRIELIFANQQLEQHLADALLQCLIIA